LFAPKIANFAFKAEKWRSGKLAQTKHDDNHRLRHQMAAIWKRGNYWRVEVRRLGYAPGGWEFKENRENECSNTSTFFGGNKAVPIWLTGITPQDAQPHNARRAE
jgi:hypothetical protein